MKNLIFLALVWTMPAWSQDLTHPLEMGLPESDYMRPDPTDYQLSLENGLVAYIAEAGQVPLVTMSAFVRAGKVSDDAQGVAESLQDALQHSGPSGMDAREFLSALERMTAEYTVEIHDEWMEITLNVPVEDFDRALQIFAAVLRDPSISNANIERASRGAPRVAGDLGGESGAALYEGSMPAAVKRFYEVLYKNHPYGRKPTADDFEDLETEDVKAFHAKFFVPGNMTLAFAGAIDVDDVHDGIASLFAGWAAADVPEPRRMPPVTRSNMALHHYPAQKLQCWLVMGHDLPVIPLEEQAAFDVMNYIMGAVHLNTRMMVETRYKYGYTNDASGFPEPRWFGPGSYTYRSYSRPEVIQNIYDNMLGELIGIRDEEVTDRELFVAKGALADGTFPIRYLDGYALTRNFALERLQYGNHDRSASYVERVRAVTKGDVLDAARKYIRPESIQVVLFGEEAIDIE